ncbi:hypothetical protein IT072_04290 [Leifsonia sp. ZF2019]|uniref:hypothetical protein n=1 Tax=Leifsonia sp. ZF2019 TaxID=2781978 RepID=UPI001CBD7440|nr:hypothetical protein [Leifsonia sp. ZF2019]UAJ80274.1 hypothetical protein IT072_04290 [Leifsonia sp. ZF2019]
MKEIAYAGRTVCTSDEAGTLVVRISALLAKRNVAEAISVPIRAEAGDGETVAEMVVGLGNDVLATPCDGDDDVAIDASRLLGDLRERLAELDGSKRVGRTSGGSYFDDLDLL